MSTSAMIKLIEARQMVLAETKKTERLALAQEAQRQLVSWLEARTDDVETLVYVQALAMTILMAPFASELYNFAWQELDEQLNDVQILAAC